MAAEEGAWTESGAIVFFPDVPRIGHLCVPHCGSAELLRGPWMAEAGTQNEEAVICVRGSEIRGSELGPCSSWTGEPERHSQKADGTGPPHTSVVIDPEPDQRRPCRQRAPSIQWSHRDSTSSPWFQGRCEPRSRTWEEWPWQVSGHHQEYNVTLKQFECVILSL